MACRPRSPPTRAGSVLQISGVAFCAVVLPDGSGERGQPRLCRPQILRAEVETEATSAAPDGGDDGGAGADEGVEDEAAGRAGGEDGEVAEVFGEGGAV